MIVNACNDTQRKIESKVGVKFTSRQGYAYVTMTQFSHIIDPSCVSELPRQTLLFSASIDSLSFSRGYCYLPGRWRKIDRTTNWFCQSKRKWDAQVGTGLWQRCRRAVHVNRKDSLRGHGNTASQFPLKCHHCSLFFSLSLFSSLTNKMRGAGNNRRRRMGRNLARKIYLARRLSRPFLAERREYP